MNHSIRRLYQGTFGAVVIAALGFGALQALATPALAATERCTWEMNQNCIYACQSEGYGTGKCVIDRNTGVAVCECY